MKKLSKVEIMQVLNIIDRWSGKLTWPLLSEVITRKLDISLSRQAFNSQTKILTAFRRKKQDLKKANELLGLPPLQIENIKLQEQIKNLERDINKLVEQQLRCISNMNSGIVATPNMIDNQEDN